MMCIAVDDQIRGTRSGKAEQSEWRNLESRPKRQLLGWCLTAGGGDYKIDQV